MTLDDSASPQAVLRSRRPQTRLETSCQEPGDLGGACCEILCRTAGEGSSRTARVYISEESDSRIIPMNHSNKDGKPYTESEEGRPLIKENTHQPSTYSTQSEKRVSQGLAGVRMAARENKEMKFTALLHHLTVDLLRESFYALKRKAAPGVDGVTWQEYETGLQNRLVDLHSRVHRALFPLGQDHALPLVKWITVRLVSFKKRMVPSR
jgi:hypothetical protein